VLVWNVGGSSVLEVWRPADGSRRSVELPDGGVVGGVTVDEHGATAVLDLTSPTSPPTLWSLDLRSANVQRLGTPPGGAAPTGPLVSPTLERFVAHDGLELDGWLYRPPGATGPTATVLSFHGGPEAQERPAYSALYQALLDTGIAVFAPNVRGSTGYGRTFEELDTADRRFDAIRDIAAAASFVVEAGVAEPGRLGIFGPSYGGFLVLAGITEYPELFDAAVDVCGIANFETFFDSTEPWMAETSRRKYGDPDTQRALLRALSPIHRMDRVRTPTLVVHGSNDTNVPLRESEQVSAELRTRGVPVQELFLPDEGHCLRGRPARLQMITATARWFARHLLPVDARP
jgi:dipeptidyl aminopeptidase/acylaminoacyl peptidase